MSAVGTAAAPAAPTLTGVTFARVLRSELLKLTSLRSTRWTLLATGVVIVVLGLLVSATLSGGGEAPSGAPALGDLDPVTASLNGTDFAVLLVGVLGVLVSAREYATGQVRTTFAAVPTRLPVLWAKAVVAGGLVLAVTTGAAVLALLGGQAVLGAAGEATASLGDEGVLRAVLGSGVELAAMSLLGLGLGVLLRGTAGALGTLLGAVLLGPTILAALLPDGWDDVLAYLPSNAGTAFTAVTPAEGTLAPWVGLAVLLAWVAVVLLGAAAALVRRDA